MTIHLVQKGETVYSIAAYYGVSADRLILENEIKNPDRLAVGEVLVIQFPKVTYTVQQGDTVKSIADKHGITLMELLRNNPNLSEGGFIYPGEMLVISYEGNKTGFLTTNGFAYSFIDINVLRKTLPFLTYITVFSYQVTADGSINNIEDEEIIQSAVQYGVAPIMMLAASAMNRTEEIEVIRTLMLSTEIQEKFFNNLLIILQTKGYYGVNISIPYIHPGDVPYFNNFLEGLYNQISGAGYKVFITFSIPLIELLTGTIYHGLMYSDLSSYVDGITLISYGWGYSLGIPPGIVPLEITRRFLRSILEYIPPQKVQIGVPDMGFEWGLPYDPGNPKGMAISYDFAIDLAVENNTEIKFDELTNSAYYQYSNPDEYVVRFWDARSMDTLVRLIPVFGLNGIGARSIMIYFPQLWLIINSQYEINKVI